MLTVRFPNGLTVQYNNANHLVYDSSSWRLYTDSSKKTWIASIQPSAGVIVEAERACCVYDATKTSINEEVRALAKEIRSLKRKIGK